ncbi:sorbosone dehydrogenase family protein [Methylocaldum sp.]|uniref:PQQ-dependent sugar dehydrogenase n=1 Tax=Methylocaldum sp. TaxID=1969727 RepID=UPI002D43EC3B|nr:sorbosone dehydrogenase family protein [Methylocaldum sp.]HYE37808.1 sorbosone dehydrogenase family protein [Methylocaldum sp.]
MEAFKHSWLRDCKKAYCAPRVRACDAQRTPLYACASRRELGALATVFSQSLKLAAFTIGLTVCCDIRAESVLSEIRLPRGFRITVYTDQTPGARSLALGDDGTVYVGSMDEGKVYAVRDQDRNGKADQVQVLATNLNMPNGVAVVDGDLYVAEVSRILKFKDIGRQVSTSPKPEIIFDRYPDDVHHGWKYLRVGPDGKLYVPVGAPCNVCLPKKEIYATLTRLDKDGSNFEIYARGIRNTVGFDWHPETKELWLTENGRDWMGDDMPPDELNHAPKPGLHFGFPHCHGKDIADPSFGKGKACAEFEPPAWTFPAHVAALGMRFYTGKQFPAEYQGQLFVAQHGSWNRSTPDGYRVVMVEFQGGKPINEKIFAEGWLRPNGKVLGRPVDILQMPDGALVISDDKAGALYRIVYQP